MGRKIWIMNHYAGNMLGSTGGRHYWFADYLRRAGHEPVIFCCNAKHGEAARFIDGDTLWAERQAEEIGVPFVFVRSRTYMGNGRQRVLNMIDFYRNVPAAAREYAALHGKPDVILASSVHPLTILAGLRLGRAFGVPCIAEVRDLWPESIVAYGLLPRKSPVTRALYGAEKWLYKKADAVVMTWPGGYDYIRERGWNGQIPEGKVHFISNGVDMAGFDQNREHCVLPDADLDRGDAVNFVYTGAIRRVNNVGALVDAAKLLQDRGRGDIRILVWGRGDETETLQARAAALGLGNIIFKGFVEKQYIPSLLSRADVNILQYASTSLNKYGQSQNKFFEYLAAGRPVLMTYSVGYSVCASHHCGIELTEQTPESIADAMAYFADLPEAQRREMGENARDAAGDFDFSYLTDKLMAVIDSVSPRRPNTPLSTVSRGGGTA